MKQLFTICLLLFCMSYIALAQSYYYGDDSKIALEVNQKSYIVFTHSEQSLELLARSPKFIPGVQSLEIYPHKKYAVITIPPLKNMGNITATAVIQSALPWAILASCKYGLPAALA